PLILALQSSKIHLGRRNRSWEVWDCQLGNLTAGKVSGGGGSSSISDGANLYGARATGAAPGTKSIWNSTCRLWSSPGSDFLEKSEVPYSRTLQVASPPTMSLSSFTVPELMAFVFHVFGSWIRGIIPVMPLCSTLKTSHNLLIHYLASLGGGSGIGNPAISGQMSNPVALHTSYSARAYMMKLTLVAERQGSQQSHFPWMLSEDLQ
ncbi:hypothetical protein Tco_0651101, partial [Tanacetum coccineum]